MISLHDVYKSYGAKNVLSNINVKLQSKSINSVIGPNGSGKSTFLMSIARLLNINHGNITLSGRNINEFSISEYARKISTLRQSTHSDLRITVEELISFGRFPYNRGNLTNDDMRIVNESINFLSLNSLRDSYINEISGGQRQMAFLAMTMAQQTEVLLLDEPLNNLDMKHSVQVMQSLRRLCDEYSRTVILVIHDINFAANYSDYIIALKKGEIFFSGLTNEVITEDRLKELYEIDFHIIKNNKNYICNYFNPHMEISHV